MYAAFAKLMDRDIITPGWLHGGHALCLRRKHLTMVSNAYNKEARLLEASLSGAGTASYSMFNNVSM